jgi:hypothetical protein
MSLTLQSARDEQSVAKLLRKVARDNQSLTYSNSWRASASPKTEWKLRFNRTIKGKLGEPDEDIEVQTDIAVRQPSERSIGTECKSFYDSQPVIVHRPSSIHFGDSETATLAKLLSQGAEVHLHASSGSTSSSYHGLAFYHVELTLPGFPYSGVTIGSQTVTKDGKQIVAGAVNV